MNQIPTDRESYTYLIHDIEALHSTVYFKLTRVNEAIRVINKQAYIHKQVNCLEKLKARRKDADKLISKVNELLEICRKDKKINIYSNFFNNTEIYKSLKNKYFELE